MSCKSADPDDHLRPHREDSGRGHGNTGIVTAAATADQKKAFAAGRSDEWRCKDPLPLQPRDTEKEWAMFSTVPRPPSLVKLGRVGRSHRHLGGS